MRVSTHRGAADRGDGNLHGEGVAALAVVIHPVVVGGASQRHRFAGDDGGHSGDWHASVGDDHVEVVLGRLREAVVQLGVTHLTPAAKAPRFRNAMHRRERHDSCIGQAENKAHKL